MALLLDADPSWAGAISTVSQRSLHVRSLIALMSGLIKSPVTGPARFSSGICAGSAPRNG
jgi:hypothetical protein